MTATSSLVDRICERASEDENGCWVWRRSLNGAGYGLLWDGTRLRVAHRISYEAFVGPIPDGLQLDHLCRVRACVNPWHLDPVTRLVNVRRGAGNVAKTHCPKNHPYDEQNTYVFRGARVCKKCSQAAVRRHRARKKAAALADTG